MKQNITKAIQSNRCTGCCVCENICPLSAISMQENTEGFIHPIVDENKCINCGLCVERCPLNNVEYINNENPECRALWAKDEIRMTAASGGIFSAFAEKIIDRGGVVCGAAYNNDFSVSHIATENMDGLAKIKSSKYVQSNAGQIYREVKSYLEAGREVLFSGCPCQVAGLYSFLGKHHITGLYSMDIICHGVPSPKVFRKYISETFDEREILKVDFRAKEYYGWSTEMTVSLSDGTIYRDTHDRDPFYRAFLPCMSLRIACESCLFSRLPRQGDLTIGDFWGIDEYKKELNDKKGTSIVLVNNEKGSGIIKECSDLWMGNEIVPIEKGLVVNKTIVGPFRAHPARRRFFENLDRYPLNPLVDQCLTHHYDVGIVGLWYGLNYGSILTYYALNRVITDMGYQCLMINKPRELWGNRYEDYNSVANKFIYKNCYVSNVRKNHWEWSELNYHCNTFVLGSDVVWNYEICGKQSGNFFHLDFVKNEKKKIAYASSFGGSVSNNYTYEAKANYYFHQFDHISVREKSAVGLFCQHYNMIVDQVIDPVFLCDMKYYDQAISQSKRHEATPFLASYFLGPSYSKKNAIIAICKELNLEYRNLYNPNDEISDYERRLGIPLLQDVSVEDWLFYIKNCDFYIGDSYHGFCFSLLYEKQFIIMIDENMPSRDRFDGLLELLGIESRMVYSDTPLGDIIKIARSPLDYAPVREKLEKLKMNSLEWLEAALKSDKKISKDPDSSIIIEELMERVRILETKVEQ